MTEPGAPQTPNVSGTGPLEYPTNRVLAAVNPEKLSALIPALVDAGFAPISILVGQAGLRRLQQTSGDSGISGLLRRFQTSVGGDLDHVTLAQQDLEQGLALVDVEVEGNEAKERARDVLLQHGGQHITYFRPWTIETLG